MSVVAVFSHCDSFASRAVWCHLIIDHGSFNKNFHLKNKWETFNDPIAYNSQRLTNQYMLNSHMWRMLNAQITNNERKKKLWKKRIWNTFNGLQPIIQTFAVFMLFMYSVFGMRCNVCVYQKWYKMKRTNSIGSFDADD